MIGHSDITKDGCPVGRVTLDTDQKAMTVLVLRSVSEAMYKTVVSALMDGAPEGVTVTVEVIEDDHFFDLFMKGVV